MSIVTRGSFREAGKTGGLRQTSSLDELYESLGPAGGTQAVQVSVRGKHISVENAVMGLIDAGTAPDLVGETGLFRVEADHFE